MAVKTVYFYDVKIRENEKESLYLKHKNIIEKHGKKHGKSKSEYISINLYDNNEEDDEKRIVLDVLEHNKTFFFGRLGRPSKAGTIGKRDYESGSLEDVLTAEEELKRGIQLVNYFYFVYSSNILCITNTKGGAKHFSFNDIVNIFEGEGVVSSFPIPNEYGLNAFYKNDYSKIKSIEFESADIDSSFLKHILNLDDKTLLQVQENKNKVGIYLKADRDKFILDNKDVVRNAIDSLKEGVKAKKLNKAKIKGSTNNEKKQEYDLMSLYYKYTIDVKLYRYENGRKHSYDLEELKIEYLSALKTAYNEKKEIFSKMKK